MHRPSIAAAIALFAVSAVYADLEQLSLPVWEAPHLGQEKSTHYHISGFRNGQVLITGDGVTVFDLYGASEVSAVEGGHSFLSSLDLGQEGVLLSGANMLGILNTNPAGGVDYREHPASTEVF